MKRLLILLLFAAPCFAQQQIAVQNPSFESGISEWIITPVKAYDGNYGNAQSVVWTGAPDGSHVASVVNASISQDLKVAPQVGVYTVKFFTANWFYSYPSSYTASLTVGGKAICPAAETYPLGDFTEITIVCTVPSYIATYHNYGYSGNLGISFTVTGPWWPVLIDKISLTFVPQS